MRCSIACALVMALALASASPSLAQDSEPEESDEEEVDPNALRWPEQYRRVHWAEAVAAPVLVAGGFGILLGLPAPDYDADAITRFDRSLGSRLTVENDGARRVLKKLGDAGYLGSFAYRAFDDLVIAGAIRGGWDAAWQMLVIDVLSFGIVGAVTFTSQLAFGRERPKYTFCRDELGDDDPSCDGGGRTNRSFISGHHAIAVTGAALTCLHHSRMRIYRTKRSGRAACASHAAMAALVGISRATTEAHWPTDILLGSALGFFAGWVVPRLIHYGFDEHGHGHGQWAESTASRAPRFRMAVLPDVGPGRLGLGAFGMW